MIIQYSWVLKVLDSCDTEKQIITCEKLFELFMNKWEDEMTMDKNIELTSLFEKIKKTKILTIRKKQLLSL
jgi:uncharacterized protein YeaO (DUF488 family)